MAIISTVDISDIKSAAQELENMFKTYLAEGEQRSLNFAQIFTPGNLKGVESVQQQIANEIVPGEATDPSFAANKIVDILKSENDELEKCKNILVKFQDVLADLEKVKD
jgi:hypothetical protein